MYPIEIQTFDSWKVTGWNDLGKKVDSPIQNICDSLIQNICRYFFDHDPPVILLQFYILLIPRCFPGVMKARCL